MEKLTFLIDDIYKIYKSAGSLKEQVPTKSWYKNKIFWAWIVISAFCILLLFLPLPNYFKPLIFGLSFILMFAIFSFFILNKGRIKNFSDGNFFNLWYNNSSYKKERNESFIDLLKDRYNMDVYSLSVEQLNGLIGILNVRGDRNKWIFPFRMNYLVTFLVPIWGIAISILFVSVKEIKKDEVELNSFATTIFLVLTFWYILSLFKWEIDQIFNRKSNEYKEIAEIFEEIKVNKLIFTSKTEKEPEN